jgi:hypothetical protein
MFMTRKPGHLVVPVLLATAFQALMVGAWANAPSTSKTSHGTSAKPAARHAYPARVPKSPITISLTSTMRHGNLEVSLDGVPVFNEEFQKPFYVISQTTTWDPLQITAGKHKLTAKVIGTNGKTCLSGLYDLEVSRKNGIELRFKTKGDKLTVEPAS